MNKRTTLLIILLISLVIIPGVLADDNNTINDTVIDNSEDTVNSGTGTEINVRTIPGYKVSVFILADSESYELLESFHKTAENLGGLGYAKVKYSGDEESLKVNVKIIDQFGETVLLEKFGKFDTGPPLNFQVIPGQVSSDFIKLDLERQKAIEETNNRQPTDVPEPEVEEEVEIEDNEAKSSSGITGSAILEGFGNIPKGVYYSLGGIIVVGLVIFLIIKGKIPMNLDAAYKGYEVRSSKDIETQLEDAQAKIRDAQAEIIRIKNQDKIIEAEEKLKKQKEEIEKLKRGE